MFYAGAYVTLLLWVEALTAGGNRNLRTAKRRQKSVGNPSPEKGSKMLFRHRGLNTILIRTGSWILILAIVKIGRLTTKLSVRIKVIYNPCQYTISVLMWLTKSRSMPDCTLQSTIDELLSHEIRMY